MPPQLQLEHLRCPVTGGKLEWLPDGQLQPLRQAVLASQLVSHAGDLVTLVPTAMLVCRDAGLAYSVHGGIPVLVPGEAIALGQVETQAREDSA